VANARPLSAAFLAAQADPIHAGMRDGRSPKDVASEALELALVRAIARAREAFPDVDLGDEAFARFLGTRVVDANLDAARAADLWAACACGTGNGQAIVSVEARYFPDIDAALAKMGLSSDRAGDVKQTLRRVLFVGDPHAGVAPRILEYRGTGDLRAWLRITAMRAALKLLRKDRHESPSDDAVLEARAQADDPELAYMKAAYRASFKVAFQEALDSLDPQEKTLLKQQIVDGLTIDELAPLYEVHRATAARWLQAAREKLLQRTRRAFMVHTRISNSECESIMRLVASQLDVSLHRRLLGG
jgi:RNA polymerase sigma-70 factor (ECF subfamily)